MTPVPSVRLSVLTVIALVGTLTGVAVARPELVAVGAGAAAVIVVSLARAPRPRVEATLEPAQPRAFEGDRTEMVLAVTADTALAHVEVGLPLPSTVEVEAPAPVVGPDGMPVVVLGPAAPGQVIRLPIRLHARRWGAVRIRHADVWAQDAFGTTGYRWRAPLRAETLVYPRPPALAALLRPLDTCAQLGALTSSARGDGIEVADLRPLTPGDDPRHIHWRTSARRGDLWVAPRHPERNAEIVLLIDTLAEAQDDTGGTLEVAVRAAAALAAAHLARRDRVGVIGFGGTIAWVEPGMGLSQRYRILDTLLTSKVWMTALEFDADAVPRRALPAGALVIALTPLLDQRFVTVLADLRGRGVDLAIVEVDPAGYLPPPQDDVGGLARRVLVLEREALRRRFLAAGVAVASWSPDTPFTRPLTELGRLRWRLAHRA